MAWTKTTKRGFLIASEDITLAATLSAQSASSAIDFLPYGKDFIVQVAYATVLQAVAPLDVQVSDSLTGTYAKLAQIATLATTLGTYQANFDNSANGNAPYYKIAFNPATDIGDGSQVATVTVMVPPKGGIVY